MSHNLQLAEINIARTVAPLDDPRMAEFIALLDEVNAAADQSPWFVWRLKSETGGASTYIRAFDDPRLLINISVWESIEALKQYVYRSATHGAVFRDRRKWFEELERIPMALWWVPAGHIPSIEEGIDRLELIWQRGPTAQAFTLKHPYSPESVSVET